MSYAQNGQIAISDGEGGVFFASGGWDWYHPVYIYHLGPDGHAVAPWPAAGVRIWITSGPEPASLQPSHPNDVEGAGPGDIMPSIALNGSGGLLVSWTHVSRAAQSVHVMNLSSSGIPLSGWAMPGTVIWPWYEDQFQSCVCSDGGGGAFVTWADEIAGIIVHHLLSNGAVDSRWPPEGISVCDSVRAAIAPAMVPDDHGGCLVTWQQPDTGSATVPMIQHLLVDGTVAPGWSKSGRVLSPVPSEPGACRTYQGYIFPYSSMVADGAGGAIVTWSEQVNGRSQTYAERVRGDGSLAPGWSDGGMAVAPAVREQQLPTIAADGSGGAFIAWQSWAPVTASASNEFEIAVQHLGASGEVTAGWTPSGYRLASGPGTRQHPVVAADGLGGAVVAWEESQGGNANIFMSHADPTVATVPPGRVTGRFSLEGLRPNPAPAGVLRVAFELPGSAPATLELLDLAGRRVAAREVGSLGAGAHVIAFDAPRSLSPGLYFLTLRSGNLVRTARAVIVR